MPEAPAAPPPAAPPSTGSATVQEVTIVDTPPPAPPKTPPGEVHLDRGPQPAVKKGSAMERMQQELEKKAKKQFWEPEEEAAPKPQVQEQPPAEHKAEVPPEGEGDQQGKTVAPPSPSSEEKKGEKNPWKLVDTYKSEAAKAKQRIAELEKAVPEMAKLTEYQKQLEEHAKRNEALEKEIRFVNYQKSQEWQEQYEKPWHALWARAKNEIEQIQATDRNGEARPGNIQDLAEIGNLPLGEAQRLAEERFGSLANYVMGYRSKLLEMNQARQEKLEQAREASIKRDEEYQNQYKQVNEVLAKTIKETWDKANTDMLEDKTHGHLFKEVEGDQDGNERLAKGLELVNRAFSENPNDPRLSPEQRAEVVRRHAAVRMRAAAFGRVNAQYQRAMQEIERLKKQLDGYKASTPTTGSTNGSSAPAATPARGMDRVFADLQRLAK